MCTRLIHFTTFFVDDESSCDFIHCHNLSFMPAFSFLNLKALNLSIKYRDENVYTLAF